MKELSIEEKAKRYDEAIEIAKNNYDTIVGMDENCTFARSGIINTFHHIFPELKESEDEKLREQVVYAINQLHVCECTKNKLIAWLEKQGEHNLIEIYPIFRVGDYIRNKKTGDKVLIKQLDIATKAYYYVSYDGAAVNHSDFSFLQQNEWEIIGQNITEQKPTDEEMKILLQTEYEKGKADAIEQKSAWSEEDEGNFSQLHKLIVEKAYLDYEIDTDGETLYGKWLKLDNWLKSLKERYAWKPSDEQLNALDEVYKTHGANSACRRVILRLLNDLKKL